MFSSSRRFGNKGAAGQSSKELTYKETLIAYQRLPLVLSLPPSEVRTLPCKGGSRLDEGPKAPYEDGISVTGFPLG
jgi:hypothetical protein